MCLHPFFQVGQDPPGVHARQLEYTMLVAVLQYRFLMNFRASALICLAE
ncbi:hypothetical protein G7K71_18845 [Desulfofundulus sp. TPOSR]|nr:hypothetical protein [Desulfofundulus sp. TPOSR]NHM28982.1 hypothetical protein [Desulfofundulus sp. TPOSR]